MKRYINTEVLKLVKKRFFHDYKKLTFYSIFISLLIDILKPFYFINLFFGIVSLGTLIIMYWRLSSKIVLDEIGPVNKLNSSLEVRALSSSILFLLIFALLSTLSLATPKMGVIADNINWIEKLQSQILISIRRSDEILKGVNEINKKLPNYSDSQTEFYDVVHKDYNRGELLFRKMLSNKNNISLHMSSMMVHALQKRDGLSIDEANKKVREMMFSFNQTPDFVSELEKAKHNLGTVSQGQKETSCRILYYEKGCKENPDQGLCLEIDYLYNCSV